VLGAIAQFEKASLVAKLKGARDRRRAITGKCEGRRSHAELHPEVVADAKRLRRGSPKGRRRSLREIAVELERLGYLNQNGRRYEAVSIRSMLTK
jgi:hypothetical protein